MEAPKPHDFPIERMWDYTNSIFQELSIFYRQPFHRHITFLDSIPRVVTFKTENFRDSISIYPRFTTKKANNERLKIIEEMLRYGIPASYDPYGMLGFFYNKDYFNTEETIIRTMTEEITHHRINFGSFGFIEVNKDELRGLNDTIGGIDFGDRLVEALESLEQIKGKSYLGFDLTPRVDMAEFFVPISLAYIFSKKEYINNTGVEFENPQWPLYIYFPEGTENDPDYQEENCRKAYTILDTIKHLPYFAGHRLVMEYEGDVKAIINECPNLATMDPRFVWEQMTRPLLVDTHG